MFFIESERLKMIPLTHELLQLLHNDRSAMELSLGLNISNPQIDSFYKKEIDDAMVNFWLPETLAHPNAFEWYTDWEIILKCDNVSVGGMGFLGEPNKDGEVETGYMINHQHRNKGYATEALSLLTKWAFNHDNIKLVIVHTYNDNISSKKILTKCGFTEIEKNSDGLLTYKLLK